MRYFLFNLSDGWFSAHLGRLGASATDKAHVAEVSWRISSALSRLQGADGLDKALQPVAPHLFVENDLRGVGQAHVAERDPGARAMVDGVEGDNARRAQRPTDPIPGS